jgi:hypothetical protein
VMYPHIESIRRLVQEGRIIESAQRGLPTDC